SRGRHTRFSRDWSSDVCSSDLDGDVVGWGSDGYGQVSGIPGGLKPVGVVAGGYHSLALYSSESVETPINLNPFSNITNLQFYDNNLNILNHQIAGGRITIEIPDRKSVV